MSVCLIGEAEELLENFSTTVRARAKSRNGFVNRSPPPPPARHSRRVTHQDFFFTILFHLPVAVKIDQPEVILSKKPFFFSTR